LLSLHMNMYVYTRAYTTLIPTTFVFIWILALLFVVSETLMNPFVSWHLRLLIARTMVTLLTSHHCENLITMYVKGLI
jgi:hypothetical protein